nr:GNAT family protein [Thermoplasma sp.]
MRHIENTARSDGFHKIALTAFPFNEAGQALYRKMGCRIVGIFRDHGKINGSFFDVMSMEKIL